MSEAQSHVGEVVEWAQSVHHLARSATDVLDCFPSVRVFAHLRKHPRPFAAKYPSARYDRADSPESAAPALHRGRQRPRAPASPSRRRYSQYSPRRNRPNTIQQAFPHHSAAALVLATRPEPTGTPDNLLPVRADSAKSGPVDSACRSAAQGSPLHWLCLAMNIHMQALLIGWLAHEGERRAIIVAAIKDTSVRLVRLNHQDRGGHRWPRAEKRRGGQDT